MVAAAAMACAAPGPVVVHYGQDLCDHCHMTISDPSYGGQVVTRTGRAYRFDDAGCLAAFIQSGEIPEGEVLGIWFSNYLDADDLVPLADAVFVRHERFHTPMGSTVAVVREGPAADSLVAALEAERPAWSEVLTAAATLPRPGAAP
jgi:copper chaperone NosL